MVKSRTPAGSGKQGRSSTERALLRAPLLGVLAGAAMIGCFFVSLHVLGRWVGLDMGGACSSGGPYVIRPGHECQPGVFALGYGGVVCGMIGFALFLWGSHRYGRQLVVTAASTASFSGFFASLGGMFLSVAPDVPSPDISSEYRGLGVAFVVMAIVALIAVIAGTIVYIRRNQYLDIPKPAPGEWLAWFASTAVGAAIGIVAGNLGAELWRG